MTTEETNTEKARRLRIAISFFVMGGLTTMLITAIVKGAKK